MIDAIYTGMTYGLIAAGSVIGFILTMAFLWIAIDLIRITYNMICIWGKSDRGDQDGRGYF